MFHRGKRYLVRKYMSYMCSQPDNRINDMYTYILYTTFI